MSSPNTNRRLSPQTLNQDTDSLNGFNTVHKYNTQRQQATPENLQQTYQAMLVK